MFPGERTRLGVRFEVKDSDGGRLNALQRRLAIRRRESTESGGFIL